MIVVLAMTAMTAAMAAAASAAAPPCAAVQVTATGFSDDAHAALVLRAAEDVRGRGVAVCTQQTLEPSAECLAEVSCARDIVRGAEAQWLVSIELLRAGANVMVTARLIGIDGRREIDLDVSRAAHQVNGVTPLVPQDVLAALVRSRDAVLASEKPAEAVVVPAAEPQAPPALVADATSAPDEPEAAGIPPIAVGGVVLTGAGVLLAAVGAATAVGQLGVINDAGSPGADKEQAAVLVPVMATVGLVGLTAAGAGAVLLGVGFAQGDAGDD